MSEDFPITLPPILQKHADILTYISRFLGCCYAAVDTEILLFRTQKSNIKKNMETLSMDTPTRVFPICAMYKGLTYEDKIENMHYRLLRMLQAKDPPKIDRSFIRANIFLKISEKCADQHILYILANLDDCYETNDFDTASDIIYNYAIYDAEALIYLLCTIFTLLLFFSKETQSFEEVIAYICEKMQFNRISNADQEKRLKNGFIIAAGAIGIFKGYSSDYSKNMSDLDRCDLFSYFSNLFSSK